MSHENEVAPASAPPPVSNNEQEEKEFEDEESYPSAGSSPQVASPRLTTEDLRVLSEVRYSLQNGTVGWEKAVQVMKLTNQCITEPEVQAFLDPCFSHIISILLDQQVGKIGLHERNCVERSLEEAASTLSQLFALGNHEYLTIAASLLDRKKPLYKGTKTYWNNLPGAMEIRHNLIVRFSRCGFFQEVAEALQSWVDSCSLPESSPSIVSNGKKPLEWKSAEIARILLIAVQELRDYEEQGGLIEIMCPVLMKQIADLSEEKLKKEPTVEVSGLVQQLRSMLLNTSLSLNAFELCMELTLKYLRSNSLPLRLFGLEQLPELVETAAQSRPPPRSYIVEGAGVPEINGEYKYAGNPQVPGPPKYIQVLSDGAQISLFRCTMRSRAKWWFISEADKLSPGTDKDIDYYQHRSTADEELEPPETGWVTCSSQGAQGLEPAPTLRRVGFMCEPGQETETLEYKLLRWITKHKVLDECFGPGIHREVVARSQCILRFLNRMGALNASDLLLIWRTAIGKGEVELQAEIYSLIASMAAAVKEDVLVSILDSIRASSVEAFSETVDLAEKLHKEGLQSSLYKKPNACASLLKLLWSLLLKPEITKEKAYLHINNFFLESLRYARNDSYQKNFINECLDFIRSSLQRSPTDVDEDSLMRALKLLNYLLESLSLDSIEYEVELLSEKQDVSALLFSELTSFKHRVSMDQTRAHRLLACPEEYEASLSLRTDLLLRVHSVSAKVNLNRERLAELWNLLGPLPLEKEIALFFLYNAGSRNNNSGTQPAFSTEEFFFVFKQLVCDANLDWSKLGERAYNCFALYFTELCVSHAMDGPEELRTAGMDALWRIVLTSRMQPVPSSAQKLLLRTYRGLANYRNNSGDNLFPSKAPWDDFLERIFSFLSQVEEDFASPFTSSDSAELGAERCLTLLKEAVGSVSTQIDSGGALPHGVRGTGAKISINILARRMGRSSPPSPGAYQSRNNIEKLEPCTLEVHPLDTFGSLRARIAAKYDSPPNLARVMHNSKQLVADDSMITKLGLQDGDELNVFFVAKTQAQSPQSLHMDGSLSSLNTASSTRRGSRASMNTPRTFNSLADTIAQNTSYFTTMFNLLSCCSTKVANNQLTRVIWDVLLVLPTQSQFEEQVSNAALAMVTEDSVDVETPPLGWEQLLPVSHWHRAVYTLQIIDALLQPAAAAITDFNSSRSTALFRRGFVQSLGFLQVLQLFMQTRVDATSGTAMGNGVALRIVKFCLFGPSQEEPGSNERASMGSLFSNTHSLNDTLRVGEDEDDDTQDPSEEAMLRTQMLGSVDLVSLLEKLFQTALSAQDHASGESASCPMVLDALVTVQLVLDTEAQSQEKSGAKKGGLLESLLARAQGPALLEGLAQKLLVQSPSKSVRKQASRLIIANQALIEAAAPHLFTVLAAVEASSTTSRELFFVLQYLIAKTGDLTGVNARQLAAILAQKLMTLPRSVENPSVLNGCLGLVKDLIALQKDCSLFEGTALGNTNVEIMRRIFVKFLFEIPTEENSLGRSLCVESESRRIAFDVILAAAKSLEEAFEELFSLIEDFNGKVVPGLRYKWGYECSFDAKQSSIKYVGLKNQGCTCYMNSLLQQLFMHPGLRKVVTSARVHKTWQVNMNPEKLVGQTIILEWESGHALDALVMAQSSNENAYCEV